MLGLFATFGDLYNTKEFDLKEFLPHLQKEDNKRSNFPILLLSF